MNNNKSRNNHLFKKLKKKKLIFKLKKIKKNLIIYKNIVSF